MVADDELKGSQWQWWPTRMEDTTTTTKTATSNKKQVDIHLGFRSSEMNVAPPTLLLDLVPEEEMTKTETKKMRRAEARRRRRENAVAAPHVIGAVAVVGRRIASNKTAMAAATETSTVTGLGDVELGIDRRMCVCVCRVGQLNKQNNIKYI
jgi:hypothetical protein